ncbi:XRE family transcriptional regulator [Colidextribacter sp. OB.20]|uniref:helix-turn-helix domain-containing protein n=1 Tax=Colidextribacter sp. OB.20 TaxID=2304568 RepID=UPI001370E9FB|nr:helix-turn-helix transcriptional regulator [Colidextribacter sp. OB.20]NBI10310.1 XRE family transcriptional regulator [Colidextribacter sp. OB.20]
MTLAEKILSLRTEKGMSQDSLAEKLEVSRQSVSKWETGQSTPDLDKIIKLADLFGVSVDELVREGERPQPPEPPQPQVVYVEREKRGLTPIQTLGVVMEITGVALAVIGIMGAPLLIWAAAALVILGLPLLLARKHPFLITGWLAVALSCLVLNPYVAVCPWGLVGGLQRLYLFITVPGIRYRSTVFAIAVGIVRGSLTLALMFFTWRAWKKKRPPEET